LPVPYGWPWLNIGKWPPLLNSAPISMPPPRSSLPAGQRLVEILKQPQYQPLPVKNSRIIIFAANNGYIDDYPVGSIRRYEIELYSFIENRQAELLKDLREKKAIDSDLDGASSRLG
jgi:F0F1-type ATP synthase alpha subunit